MGLMPADTIHRAQLLRLDAYEGIDQSGVKFSTKEGVPPSALVQATMRYNAMDH